MDWLKRKRSSVRAAKPPKEHESSGLETPEERKERWRSIYIIYFTMFLISLGFSIILTGVWPYLDMLDPTAGKEFSGLIVGINPLAQFIFSPIVGWWGNRLGSIRLPLLLSIFVFTFASGMYSSLELFDEHRKYWMLASRFLIGVSSANIALCRSYLSAATTTKERTGAVSMVSLAQVLGFIVGPALQFAVTQLGADGVALIPGKLSLNMYTAPGWINVLMGVGNFILFLPAIFTERRIAAREAMVVQGATTEEETWKAKKPDYVSVWTVITGFFMLVFNFVLLETLCTMLTMDQFAWTKAEALSNMGMIMAFGAIIACITFACIGPLCKRFPEMKVLLWGGFFLMLVGQICCIPWGSEPPLLANYNISDNITEVVGCPPSQEWCKTVNAMTFPQFILGYILTSVGYPIAVTLIQTIFSKILGSRPQGLWMGILTAAGCGSRFIGPVFVTLIYTRLGTNWTFGTTATMMAGAMVWFQLMEKRLTRADPSAKCVDRTKRLDEVETSKMVNKESDKDWAASDKKEKDTCDVNGEQVVKDQEVLEMDALESDKLYEKDGIKIQPRQDL